MDNELRKKNQSLQSLFAGPGAWYYSARDNSINLETAIQNSLETTSEKEVNLITVDQTNRGIGGGVIRLNHDWREHILNLMDHSTSIYMLPLNSTGTRWELEQLLSNPDLLYKTYFLLINGIEIIEEEKNGTEDPYQEIRKVFSKSGWDIPRLNEGKSIVFCIRNNSI